MTDNERDIKIAQTKQEVDDFKMVIESFIAEMRDRDNQRAAEIARVDAKIEALREQREADMKALAEQREKDMKALAEQREKDMKALAEQREKDNAKREATANELRQEIRDSVKHIQNMTAGMVIGLIAVVVSLLGLVFTRDSEPKDQAPPPAQTQTVQTSNELARE